MSLPLDLPGNSANESSGRRAPPRSDVANAQLWSCQDICALLASILTLNGMDVSDRHGSHNQQIQTWQRGLLQMFNTIQAVRAEVSVLENLGREGGDAAAWRLAAQYEMRKACTRFVSLIQTSSPEQHLPPRTFYEWMEDYLACRVPGHPQMQPCDPKEAVAFCMDTCKELVPTDPQTGGSNALLGYILDVASLTFPEMALELNCQNMFDLAKRLESLTLYQQLTLARVCKYLDLVVLARCIDSFFAQQQRLLHGLNMNMTHVREQWDFAEKFACALYKSIFRRLSPENIKTTALPMINLYSIKGLMSLMPNLYRQDEIATVLRRHRQNLASVGAVIPYMVTDEQNRVLCEPLRSDSGAIGLLMQGEKAGRMWVLKTQRDGCFYLLQTLLYHTQFRGKSGSVELPAETPAVLWRYSKIQSGQMPQWRVFNTVRAKSGLESLLQNLFGSGGAQDGVGPIYFYEWGLAPSTVPIFETPESAEDVLLRETWSKVFNPPAPPPPESAGKDQMSSINILKHRLIDVESGSTDSSKPSQSKRVAAWLSDVAEGSPLGLTPPPPPVNSRGPPEEGGPSSPPKGDPPMAAALSRASEAEGLSCNNGVSM